jgi:hypothetical protein
VLVAIFAPRLIAQGGFICATGDPRLVDRFRLMPQRFASLDSKPTPPLELRDGIAYLPATEKFVFGWRPFDLAGRALTFTPVGTTYRVTNTAVGSVGDRGTPVQLAGSPAQTPYQLPFAFPFFGKNVTQVYITEFYAIQLAPAERNTVMQYTDHGALAAGAMISPMLTTAYTRLYSPNVYVSATANAVTVTWAAANPFARYDLRVTLGRDGVIQFAYVDMAAPPIASAVVLTSGEESWRTETEELATATDPENDLPVVPTPKTRMLDVTGIHVTRNPALDLLRIELTMAAPIDATLLAPGETASYSFSIPSGGSALQFGCTLHRDGTFTVQGSAYGESARAAVAANRLTFETIPRVFARDVPLRLDVSTSLTAAGHGGAVDTASATTTIPAPTPLATGFAATSTSELNGPIVEAFTVGALNEGSVWTALKSQLPLDDAAIDAVAIYTDFPTDIRFFAAGYNVIGNPGAEGIGAHSSSKRALYPSLLNMNSLPTKDDQVPFYRHVILHEFGHHWLYTPTLPGADAALLAPDGAHPAQWVDTRAAFPSASTIDSSPMGGGFFTPTDSSTFVTATAQAQTSVAYSWLDLYFMGLASPAEVPQFFALTQTDPPLGSAYFPPQGSYRAMRRDLAVGDVIAAMGQRSPDVSHSKHHFRVAFVLLYDPRASLPSTEVATLLNLRDHFVTDFSNATGRRAWIDADLPTAPARRRSASNAAEGRTPASFATAASNHFERSGFVPRPAHPLQDIDPSVALPSIDEGPGEDDRESGCAIERSLVLDCNGNRIAESPVSSVCVVAAGALLWEDEQGFVHATKRWRDQNGALWIKVGVARKGTGGELLIEPNSCQ